MKLMQSAQISSKKDLSLVCKYYGIRPDLVQAGGGNISIKDGNKLYIKSSGCMLFDVEPDKNISTVNLKKVKNFKVLENVSEKDFLKKATISGSQPSLETFFHSLTAKYTVHLHPVVVVQALQKYKDKLIEKYGDVAAFIDYYKPGLELSKHIDYSKNIIFLEKHGLIVHYDDLHDVESALKDIVNYCAFLIKYDITIYNKLSELQSQIYSNYGVQPYIMYTDVDFPRYIRQTPDCVIYTNGYCDTDILPYIPVCYKNGDDNYIIAKNFLKCKQIEQVLKMYENVTTELNDEDVEKLMNWDSEKYRKDL